MSQTLKYSDGKFLTTQRGTLMGLPVGWTVLSLLHIFLVEEALRRSGNLNLKKSVFIRILGDDLVAFWPAKVNDEYNKLLDEAGLPISKGKHLVSNGRMNFARNFFVPIFESRKTKVCNTIDWFSWRGEDSSSAKQFHNVVHCNGGHRTVIGVKWVPTCALGAFAKDAIHTYESAKELSSWYRKDPV